MIVAEYSGVSVNDQGKLRAALKAQDSELNVVKNRLLKLVLKRKGAISQEVEPLLEGPTATVYGYDDPVAPAKILLEFAKDHETIKVKIGFMIKDGALEVLTADQVEALAKLPGKSELLSQLIARLNSPRAGFVNVLRGNLTGLVYALKAIQEKGIKN
jgi:large subunit ribosomal protein L10